MNVWMNVSNALFSLLQHVMHHDIEQPIKRDRSSSSPGVGIKMATESRPILWFDQIANAGTDSLHTEETMGESS